MASCPLKKRFGRKDTKGGHTTSSVFLFTGSGSFIPARLCESTAERSPLWGSTWTLGLTVLWGLTQWWQQDTSSHILDKAALTASRTKWKTDILWRVKISAIIPNGKKLPLSCLEREHWKLINLYVAESKKALLKVLHGAFFYILQPKDVHRQCLHLYSTKLFGENR